MRRLSCSSLCSAPFCTGSCDWLRRFILKGRGCFVTIEKNSCSLVPVVRGILWLIQACIMQTASFEIVSAMGSLL